MSCILFVIFFGLIPLISGGIYPNAKSLFVIKGQGFVIHLETSKGFGAIKSCWYKIGDNKTETEIDLNAKEPEELETGELILPYHETICGIRVDKLSDDASQIWYLRASDINGLEISGNISIDVNLPPTYWYETNITKSIGKHTIKCSYAETARYCKIYNDIESTEACEVYTTIRNDSNYQCHTLHWGSMLESHETILINAIPVEEKLGITINFTETEDHAVMSCQFPGKVFSCRAEYPDKRQNILIQDGLNYNKFSVLDTRTSDGKCVLEIKKPFRPAEIGIWKMYDLENKRLSGCIFYVGAKKSDLIENEIDNMKKVKTMEVVDSSLNSNQLEIVCKAPFVVDRCYMVDPNKTVHFLPTYEFKLANNLGLCIFQRLKIMPGEYTCGLVGKDYDDEVIHKYDVKIIPETGEAVTSTVLTNLGNAVKLLCRSPLNNPIDNCAFSDPKGKVYVVSNFIEATPDSRIKYFGDGIEQGHCGILIKDINQEEFGNWICHFTISTYKYSSFEITVSGQSAGISEATAIGLGAGIGAVFIVLLVGGIIYYIRRKRQSRRQTPEQEQPGTISMGSRE